MTHLRSIFVLSLAVWLGACADATPSGEGPEDARPTDALPSLDAGPEAGTDSTLPPPPVGARELRVMGDLNRLLVHNATGDFTVQYIGRDPDNAERGIPNATLTAVLLDEQNMDRSATGYEGTAFVRGQRKVTDADGRATFQLRAGMRDIQAKLQVTADDGVDPVTINVTVAREGAGGLRVTVTYDDMVGRYDFRTFGEARVDLFDRQNCDLLRDVVPNLQGAYFSLPPITPFNEVDNSVTQGDLDDGLTFSVAASVTNQMGNVVAFGCVDAVMVRGGEVVQVDIPATDLPLEFKGKFTVLNKFDLTGILRSTEDDTLNTLADVLDVLRVLGSGDGDRGEAIVQLFCELVNIDEGICDIVDNIVAPLVDRLVERFVPEPILRVLTVISDVLAIVQRMTTVGEIEFIVSGPDAENRLVGSDNRWQKFRFDWRNGCPPGENCRREFTIGNLDQERRPIAGVFDSRLEIREDNETGRSHLTLVLEPHSLNFRYGVIILGIAEQWIIPAIMGVPGPVTLQELMGNLLPCMDINDFFGDPNSGLCEDILVGALSEIIYDQISRLDFAPEAFTLQGTALPIDEDGDLVIDTLDMGEWTGGLLLGNDQFAFRGCFRGCRGEEECPPPECEVPDLE